MVRRGGWIEVKTGREQPPAYGGAYIRALNVAITAAMLVTVVGSVLLWRWSQGW